MKLEIHINKMTKENCKKILFCLVLMLWISEVGCLVVYAEDDIAIYASARKIDSVYENIFSCGTHTIVTPPVFIDQVVDKIENYLWKYTRSEKQYAIFEVLQNVLPGNSETVSNVPNRITFLCDTKRSTKKMTYLSKDVDALHYEDSPNINNAVFHSYDPDESPLDFQTSMFMYALGRGLCKKVIQIDQVKKSIDNADFPSMYCITGVGELFSSGKGRWEIYLLPDQMFMVKRAMFYSENRAKPKFELETFGIKKNGDCVFPEKSIIRIPLGSDAIEHQFKFDNAEFEFNLSLFYKTYQDIDWQLPEGSLNISTASGKENIQVVGDESKSQSYELQPRPVLHRFLFIGLINLIGISLILYLYFRNRRKK
ncbi:MAG: hypothetical protein LBF88_04120 [Planctomycetaceae bacterium]|jgi:hypothetical protein|nr:hypothetical protein [Planctomycetaceae bacterium]